MWNNGERIREGEGVVAVAVYKEKSSQYALKWAIQNLFPRNNPLKLVHVVQRPPSPPSAERSNYTLIQQERDTQALQVLLPYRCYCSRKQVQFETVVLYDPDVARALINYISVSGVETLLLGSSSRNGIARIFKNNSDIGSMVLKWAPEFCNIYTISKRKVSNMRLASRSPPTIPPNQTNIDQPFINSEPHHHERLYDEVSVVSVVEENENPSFGVSGRVSTDSNCLSFYENLGSAPITSQIQSSHSHCFNLDNNNNNGYNIEQGDPLFLSTKNIDALDHCSPSQTPSSIMSTLHNTQHNVEDEMRRLKIELKLAIDMSHAAKQKCNELEEWKMEQERRMKDMKSEAMEMVEKEKERCKEAIEAAKRFAEEEVEKRVVIKAKLEEEEKHKILDTLGRSHSLLKYQTLFHIFAVLVFCYLYFSLFNN